MKLVTGPLSDPGALAALLSSRTGVTFSGAFETVDGAVWPVVRPLEPSRPNGFSIVVARSPRHVSALFRLDTFGRELAELMWSAGPEAHDSFASVLRLAISQNMTVNVIVNGRGADGVPVLLPVPWRSLEIECDRWLPPDLREPPAIEQLACDVAFTCVSLVLQLLVTREGADESVEDVVDFPEGARTRIVVNKYERSPANRTACILAHGITCKVCGFRFGEKYGGIGDGYVEVHHLTPVSLMNGGARVNPMTDLVPVCANCHAMLHRQSPPLAVEDLRAQIRQPTPVIPGSMVSNG
jgi:5-methylcytosine-specific restriction protein A